MKKVILLIAVILLSAAGVLRAQAPLGVTLDATYASRYIWRGFDFYGRNHSAIQPSVDVDLWGTGWGFTVWWSRANGGGYENWEEIDYTVYYGNSVWEGEPHQMDYRFGYTYYNHPDGPVKCGTNCSSYKADLDRQEVFGTFSWPNVFPFGVVPSYTAIRFWPDESGVRPGSGYPWSYWRTYGGWIHVFGLDYDWTVPGFIPGTTEQVFHLSYDLVYNDGAGAPANNDSSVDHDWSHCVFGVSTPIPLNQDLTFTPGVYFQKSMDDSVNTSDEYWVTLGLTYELPNR